MLKVVCVVDKDGTALDRLAKGVAKYHDNLDYIVCDVHPKRPDAEQLRAFEVAARDADIIDWQYYRTAEKLRSMYPWLAEKKQILTHNNPYSIEEQDWNGYDLNVGNNQYIYKRLGQITDKPVEYVPLTVDTDFWTFKPDWEPNHNVIMVANRIEAKKGILPVAIACAELNLHFILVGAISDMNYFQAIMATTGNVEFHEQCTDEELRDLYHKSTIHVCNSQDNFESGTLPVLEAMLCGVPVLTRSVGHVPDLYNKDNMTLLHGEPENVLGLQDKLLALIGDKKRLRDQREAAWNSAKVRSFERRAYMYQKLYRQVMWPDQVPVSVVVPIYDKPDIIRKCLNAVANQTHKNIEVIVADDYMHDDSDYEKDISPNYPLVLDFARYISFPVRYIKNWQNDYGLARARNEATIEATGEVMVYCDQRMIMEPNAVEEFLKWLKPKTWLYGDKGAKKEFVENFSCIYRSEVINAGLFSERITAYGGMSQEIRCRIRNQGLRTEYIASAKAVPAGKSSNRNRKRQDIIKMKNRLFKMELE